MAINKRLIAENQKLREALAGLIPWVGELPDGPNWATVEAKTRNREMLEQALSDACDCFPDDYGSVRQIAESN